MLAEDRIQALETRCGKIAVVEFNGHVVVFRRPSRADVREYRRKQDSPSEKGDALDQLAQATIVAFDAEEDPTRARMAFTGSFLEDYPLAMSHPRFVTALSVLSGLVEEEDAADLGKGVTVRPTSPRPSPTV